MVAQEIDGKLVSRMWTDPCVRPLSTWSCTYDDTPPGARYMLGEVRDEPLRYAQRDIDAGWKQVMATDDHGGRHRQEKLPR